MSIAEAVLYTRRDCPLCFAMHRTAARAARRRRVPLSIIDVDASPELRERFGDQVPVLVLPGGATIRGRATPAQVEEAFAALRRR